MNYGSEWSIGTMLSETPRQLDDLLAASPGTCWTGYERTPGTKKGTKGSCRKKKTVKAETEIEAAFTGDFSDEQRKAMWAKNGAQHSAAAAVHTQAASWHQKQANTLGSSKSLVDQQAASLHTSASEANAKAATIHTKAIKNPGAMGMKPRNASARACGMSYMAAKAPVSTKFKAPTFKP